jgi:hypothetical protein
MCGAPTLSFFPHAKAAQANQKAYMADQQKQDVLAQGIEMSHQSHGPAKEEHGEKPARLAHS